MPASPPEPAATLTAFVNCPVPPESRRLEARCRLSVASKSVAPSGSGGGDGNGGDGGDGPVAVAPASGSSARRKNSVADRVLHGDVLLFARYLAFDIFGLSVMIVVVIARKAEQRVETARSEAERRERERTVKENGCIRADERVEVNWKHTSTGKSSAIVPL